MGKMLLHMSRPIHIRRPLSVPFARSANLARPSRAFDFDPEKAIPIPPGACPDYGREVERPCPPNCPVANECYEELARANR